MGPEVNHRFFGNSLTRHHPAVGPKHDEFLASDLFPEVATVNGRPVTSAERTLHELMRHGADSDTPIRIGPLKVVVGEVPDPAEHFVPSGHRPIRLVAPSEGPAILRRAA